MKKIILLLVLFTAVVQSALADEGGFYIKSAVYEAEVNQDNVWTVTETINVHFNVPRHGIYKFIPRIFRYSPDGKEAQKTYVLKIDNAEVEDRPFSIESGNDKLNSMVFKIGSGDYTVEGDQQYVIKYTLSYPDDESTSADFLCHAIWGTGWNCQIDKVLFKIHFEKPLPADFEKTLHIYSGTYGKSTMEHPHVIFVRDNTITGKVEQLSPNEGITIAAPLPQGYWVSPSKANFPATIIVFGGLTLLLGLYIFIIAFFGKRKKPVRTIEFRAPEGISSAEVGKIIDGDSDLIDLCSLIPWLAKQGYITITEVPDKKNRTGKHADLKIQRICPLPLTAPKYQQDFMKVLFSDSNKDTVYLSKLGDKHATIESAMHSLDSHFTGPKRLSENKGGIKWIVFFLLSFLLLISAESKITDFDEDLATGGMFIVGALGIMSLIRFSMAQRRYFKTKKARILDIIFTSLLIAIGAGVIYFMFDNSISDAYNWFSFRENLCIYAFCVLVILSTEKWVVDTDYRIQMSGRLLGLKRFIETAEQDRLKALVDENPAYFYDILPYAIVFGLSDKWSSQFKNINITPPEWYHTSDFSRGVATYYISSHIAEAITNNMMSHIQKASIDTTTSSSSSSWGSGSSGGGGISFSGGGGGGGGGGSW